MIEDFMPPGQRRKPANIQPLEKPFSRPLQELVAEHETSFKTPESVAQSEPSVAEPLPPTTPKQDKKRRFRLQWPPTRKQQIIFGVVAMLIVFGTGTGWVHLHRSKPVAAITPKKHIVIKKAPEPILSTLTGLPVADATVNQRPVVGVMVENSIDARPQSGLSQAGVVFEAVAEGGVTRFLAVFQDTQPVNVGPIRSARPYYVQWALGFDAAYAHVGGSPDALSDITAWGVKDMNQFYNGGSYHRVDDRAAPHNVYTGISTLAELATSKGYTSTYTGFPRKTEQRYVTPTPANTTTTTKTKTSTVAPDTRTPASSINMSLSGPTYDPHFDYNTTSNSYARSEAGEPHIDANSNTQISPKVVVAMVVQKNQGALDSSGAYYSDYTVVGSGNVFIFQDGTVITGTWSKADIKSQIVFSDSAGKPLLLNPGQAWITAISADNKVTYQ
jgi:hypothetical protein